MSNNLVLDINPEQLVSYGGNQLVGFYDGFKNGKPALYIYIKGNSDKFSVVRRRAKSRKIRDKFGDIQQVPETECYARAYKKYLEVKESGGSIDAEKEVMRARIAKLEAAAKEKFEEVKESEEAEKPKEEKPKAKKSAKSKSFDEIQAEKE